jgi:hypothetical protein
MASFELALAAARDGRAVIVCHKSIAVASSLGTTIKRVLVATWAEAVMIDNFQSTDIPLSQQSDEITVAQAEALIALGAQDDRDE